MLATTTNNRLDRRQGPYGKLEDGEIRVAHVLPGYSGSALQIRLQTVGLDDNELLMFDAISYVWGSEANKATVFMVEGDQRWPLHVTRSCEEVLERFRDGYRARTLWIDAICINQDDLEEKSRQVQMMTDIYRKASKVIVWLGPASHDSDVAMARIREISSHVAYDEVVEVIQAANDGIEAKLWAQQGSVAPITEEQTLALANLLGRPWFSRLWIWQEVHMGDRRSILRCGCSEVTWSQLKAFEAACRGKVFRAQNTEALVSRLDHVGLLCGSASPTQLDQLAKMRLSECRQPSDRLYTSQALATLPYHTVHMQPNYEKSYKKVFLDWASKFVLQHNSLGLLLHLPQLDTCADIPSWVPDWSRQRLSMNRHLKGIAHGGARSAIVSINNAILTVEGLYVTTVRRVVPSHLTLGVTDNQERIACLSRLAAAVLARDPSKDLRTLVKVLCGGELNDSMVHPASRRASLQSLVRTLTRVLDGATTISHTEAYDVSEMTEFPRGRAILITDNARMGLGPPCQRGDVVVVLLGCELPLVLRPLDDGTYQVLGEAYVEGLMAGEAVLGPVPLPHESIWSYRNNILYQAFRNTASGEVTFQDPRLPPLPKEWEDMTDPNNPQFPEFQHRLTKEWRGGLDADPRCDVELLEARGVQLQKFALV